MKSKLKIALAASVIGVCAGSANVLADVETYAYSNDNIPFHLNIQPHQHNARTTTNVNNKWKVKMTKSYEGPGTYTNFWLELYNGKNVANVVATRVEDGARYSPAYSSASQTTVYLTSENNNDNDVTYTVEGYWDEETGE